MIYYNCLRQGLKSDECDINWIFVMTEKAQWRGSWRSVKSPSSLVPLGARSVGTAKYPAGWRHPSGTIQWFNFYWMENGRLDLLVNDRPYVLENSDIMVFPPGSRIQGIPVKGAGRYRWFTLDGPGAGGIMVDFGLPHFFRIRSSRCPVELFDSLELSVREDMPGAEYRADALAYEILAAGAAGAAGFQRGETAEDCLEKCLQIIDADYRNPNLNINVLADRLGIDRSVLSRRFRKLYGIPPSEYLKRLRFRRALLLLHGSDMPVHQVARQCGFADPAYFSRLFTRELNLSPSRFRHSL